MLCIPCSSPYDGAPRKGMAIRPPLDELNVMSDSWFGELYSHSVFTMPFIFECCCACWEGADLWSSGEVDLDSERLTTVISCMLDRLLSFPPESCLIKYFWAWLATWVGVLVVTKLREIFLQSPFPYFFSPSRNCLWKKRYTKHYYSCTTTTILYYYMPNVKQVRLGLMNLY